MMVTSLVDPQPTLKADMPVEVVFVESPAGRIIPKFRAVE
jgi:hypothetical protein